VFTRWTLAVTLTAAAIGVGVAAAPAVAGPGAQSCQGEVVSSSVQPSAFGPGRRAVASTFFGDYPTAVQDAERAVQALCANQ
jgi:hypothetical protein